MALNLCYKASEAIDCLHQPTASNHATDGAVAMAESDLGANSGYGNACSIDGCRRAYYAKGFCAAHYARNRKYGDPLAGGTGWGEVRRWLETVAIPYDGDECLLFPFTRKGDGYGLVKINGKNIGPHVFVLTARGPSKPSPTHECCHSCGNGHLGCVSPRHLRWATHSENMAEAVAHGTTRNKPRFREDHHDFRATDDVVAAIKADLASGLSQKAIARKYGFAQSHISRINTGWGRFRK